MSEIPCLVRRECQVTSELRDPQLVGGLGEWASRLGTRCCGKPSRGSSAQHIFVRGHGPRNEFSITGCYNCPLVSGEADSVAALSCVALTMRVETEDVLMFWQQLEPVYLHTTRYPEMPPKRLLDVEICPWRRQPRCFLP